MIKNERIDQMYGEYVDSFGKIVTQMELLRDTLNNMPKSVTKTDEINERLKDLSLALLTLNTNLARGYMEMTGRSFNT